VKQAWIVAGLLCTQIRAGEAGFSAIRVGDSWVYSGFEQKPGRDQRIHFKVDVEEQTATGELIAVHRDPRISEDEQIGQVFDPIPAGTCVADIPAGFQLLMAEQCASPPKLGARWKRELAAAGDRKIRFEIHYSARKKIKVPAGKFEAHRFEIDQFVTSATSEIQIRRVYWFAPEVRGMVIIESQAIDQLGRRGGKLHAELQSFTAPP
jgi:hypothetical protein